MASGNEAKQQIGVRQSFTAKPPTDVKSHATQANLFQKNFKYLEANRVQGHTLQSVTDENNSRQANAGVASARRENHVYRSLNGQTNPNSAKRQQTSNSGNRAQEKTSSLVNQGLSYALVNKTQESL